MPRLSKLPRSKSCYGPPTITTTSILPFLLPAFQSPSQGRNHQSKRHYHVSNRKFDPASFFFSSLNYASSCQSHKKRRPSIAHEHCNESKYDRLVSPSSHTGCRLFSTIRQARPLEEACECLLKRRITIRHRHDWHRDRPPDDKDKFRFFDPATRDFARTSHLPASFYEDIERIAGVKFDRRGLQPKEKNKPPAPLPAKLEDQLQLVQSVRELEEKLAKAKNALNQSLERKKKPATSITSTTAGGQARSPIVLTKDDYLNLVDLYFYTAQSRFGPDVPDHSPTPLILDDYSFALSKNFSQPTNEDWEKEIEDEVSPLKEIEEMLKSRQLREIAVMQAFVDLLLDDRSSNRALFEAYKYLPDPGVAHIPIGVVRLFLQRMSTPWIKSEKSMLRYLSLIDDMQRANLRITRAEWSSAIYLAGRSFTRVTDGEVSKSFGIWKEMEQAAGVKATHVTFNILFDIAVRAEKFSLAQAVLKEMHERGLRLNRLGRVSLIYYHGIRGDGDGVRMAYRDFVEAGEIVDTLVLNCVMVSLIHAQEPAAAEQIYERMKNLQTRLRKGPREDGSESLFMKYPPPGSTHIDMEMASNHLGRILLRAAHLRDVLPERHRELQLSMPLTPDHVSFRSMLAHHASTSGDLDRLTVLMNDMQELFNLPFTSLNFQLLFKGFAVHGASRQTDGKWTVKRLNLVWESCRSFIKDTTRGTPTQSNTIELPSVQQAEAEDDSNLAQYEARPSQLRSRRLDAWEDFIIDIAVFPRERLKKPIPFSNTLFPEDAEPGAPDIDAEVEYKLPRAEDMPEAVDAKASLRVNVEATRGLVIWLIRAYTRCTGSRSRVEDVYFEVRKLWRPADKLERDAVIRVLRKALRDCDMSGPM